MLSVPHILGNSAFKKLFVERVILDRVVFDLMHYHHLGILHFSYRLIILLLGYCGFPRMPCSFVIFLESVLKVHFQKGYLENKLFGFITCLNVPL